jgi:lipid-binding SYLF domain-containing protein
MQRRDFIIKTAASIAVTGLTATGCATTATTSTTTISGTSAFKARQEREIDSNVDVTLARLYSTVRGSRALVDQAAGVLVFPSVIAAGLGIGGQYGQGALRVSAVTADYYSLASISVGLQIGAQSKAIVFLFMTQDAVKKFRSSEGWAVGADASVAVLKVGADGNISVLPTDGPVVAFVLTNAGLMANLTLEGTKITRLRK